MQFIENHGQEHTCAVYMSFFRVQQMISQWKNPQYLEDLLAQPIYCSTSSLFPFLLLLFSVILSPSNNHHKANL